MPDPIKERELVKRNRTAPGVVVQPATPGVSNVDTLTVPSAVGVPRARQPVVMAGPNFPVIGNPETGQAERPLEAYAGRPGYLAARQQTAPRSALNNLFELVTDPVSILRARGLLDYPAPDPRTAPRMVSVDPNIASDGENRLGELLQAYSAGQIPADAARNLALESGAEPRAIEAFLATLPSR